MYKQYAAKPKFTFGLLNRHFSKLVFWTILVILIYLTLTPSPPQPIVYQQIDKLYHLIAFISFSFTFMNAFEKIKPATVVFLSIALGTIIEITQYFIPNRGFSIGDLLADVAGVFIGCLLFIVFKRFFYIAKPALDSHLK